MLRGMLAQLIKRWNEIRASYWFLPSLMALLAAVLAQLATFVDARLGMEWLGNISWLHTSQPEGARSILSTIAGSMMTVAGVTFSVTIAAVAYTTAQFGPRLLGNFMRDTGNQITLGTFIATFLYCMLVLRAVRSAEDAFFVPQLALLGAFFLGVASIGVLIYFIHHVAESIHISNVVANIGGELNDIIDGLGPSEDAHERDQHHANTSVSAVFGQAAASVTAAGDGYVQNLINSSLVETAREHGLVVRIERGVGQFVHAGERVALAWPAHKCDEATVSSLRSAYALGRQRTVSQDPQFLVNELIEIAARALSPGINDPFTATSCMDWLRSGLVRLAQAEVGKPYRYDDDGELRLILQPFDFNSMADAVFHSLRPYFCADCNASVHMLDSLGRIAEAAEPEHRRQLNDHAQWLLQASMEALPDPADQARVNAAFTHAQTALVDGGKA